MFDLIVPDLAGGESCDGCGESIRVALRCAHFQQQSHVHGREGIMKTAASLTYACDLLHPKAAFEGHLPCYSRANDLSCMRRVATSLLGGQAEVFWYESAVLAIPPMRGSCAHGGEPGNREDTL